MLFICKVEHFCCRTKCIDKMERETILRAELERYLFKTKELLAANRDLVQELADALLKKQTLLHSDIQSICGRYRAVPAT